MSRVLITGCSAGIGRALAQALAARGAEVIATARDLRALADVPAAMRLALDVTSDASVAAAIAQAGPIDVLVNNAGMAIYAPVETVPLERARAMFEVNVFGMLRMVQAVAPQMRRRRKGLIVQVSSVAGRVSKPLVGHYAATKHALEALSEALRVELAEFGVKVSLVEPGPVHSDFSQKARRGAGGALGDYDTLMARFDRLNAAQPQVRGSAADAAKIIADLIEEGGSKLRYEGTPGAFERIVARFGQDDADWENSELRRLGSPPGPAPPA